MTKQNKVYTSVSLEKLGCLLEIIPGLKEKKIKYNKIMFFFTFLKKNSLRKKKLKYYIRLTRTLKRYIHKYN